MKIAHLSDPHLLSLAGVSRTRLLLNKRLTGWVNLKLHRGSVHRPQVVEAMMDDIRAQGVDHVVITGDVTNLALEPEFELARVVFARLGLPADAVSIVPGNHDVYTRGAQRSKRFAQFFAAHITSDLRAGDGAHSHPSGPFPYVRLRGEAAILGLSTAVARLPLFSSGHAGARQLEALAELLAHPEVMRRTAVVLMHHPLVNPRGFAARFARGFSEASLVERVLAAHPRAVVLHGHLHDRLHHRLAGEGGRAVHHIGATSASLLHPSRDRVAGYNVYALGPAGLEGVSARIWDAGQGGFVDGTVRDAGVLPGALAQGPAGVVSA